MEQVEGGDLVVNRGNESRPKGNSDVRDLNTVEGYDAAIKVAQVLERRVPIQPSTD